MADTNKVQLKEFSDGTGKAEVGTPRHSEPLSQSQGQHDTLKVEVIELEVANGAADVKYPTGGFPLADDGGSEITPDGDTPDEQYKFSALVALQLRRAGIEYIKIQSAHLDEVCTGGAEVMMGMYDAVNDKFRCISLVDGVELAKGDVILGTAAAKRLRIRITYI